MQGIHSFLFIVSAALFAATAPLSQAFGAMPACGIFPPPFDADRDSVAHRLGLKNTFIPGGYTDIPVLNTDCNSLPKQAHATATLIDGIPVKIMIHAMLADGRGIDEMNAFVTHYLGALPDDRHARPESERFTGIYSQWHKGAYQATYALAPDSQSKGMFTADIILVSTAYKDSDASKNHYKDTEEHHMPPQRLKPEAPAGKLPAHASDM